MEFLTTKVILDGTEQIRKLDIYLLQVEKPITIKFNYKNEVEKIEFPKDVGFGSSD